MLTIYGPEFKILFYAYDYYVRLIYFSVVSKYFMNRIKKIKRSKKSFIFPRVFILFTNNTNELTDKLKHDIIAMRNGVECKLQSTCNQNSMSYTLSIFP